MFASPLLLDAVQLPAFVPYPYLSRKSDVNLLTIVRVEVIPFALAIIVKLQCYSKSINPLVIDIGPRFTFVGFICDGTNLLRGDAGIKG